MDHDGEPLIGRARTSSVIDDRSPLEKTRSSSMALRFDAIFLSFAFAFVGAVLIGLF
jgi:hypothetical protein